MSYHVLFHSASASCCLVWFAMNKRPLLLSSCLKLKRNYCSPKNKTISFLKPNKEIKIKMKMVFVQPTHFIVHSRHFIHSKLAYKYTSPAKYVHTTIEISGFYHQIPADALVSFVFSEIFSTEMRLRNIFFRINVLLEYFV